MIRLSFLILLYFASRPGDAVGLHGFHYHGLEEPEAVNRATENITEGWIQQPLDHFNSHDNRTWWMRYLKNSHFYKEGGPILIMIGGEWEISNGFLEAGLMYELASKHNATMYYTEHRYYGKSRPTPNISSSNLQYLSVDQALADLAYFIQSRKNLEGFENSTVIVFGGSYAGGMASWARLKYPHLIQGALASSAPVFSKPDFFEYYEVVAESLRKYSQKCVDEIKAAFDGIEKLIFTDKDGLQKLKTYFNLCDPIEFSPDDLGYLMNTLAETFAGIVQYDKVTNGRTMIAATCEKMTASNLGSPIERLARLVSSNNCFPSSYKKFVKVYANETWDAQSDIMRLWYYQTCTEFGNYQTSNSKNSIFGTLFPLRYYIDICTDFYGKYYNMDFLKGRVKRTNLMYGGLHPDLRRVIFTNGEIDPWHPLSLLSSNLDQQVYGILIKNSSHCRDLYTDTPTDGQELLKARAQVRSIISSWISS
ncbi:putative serine protease K12H4.7 [Ceratina calcarata]|uniref:Serine protease K12H4.7 n=1 Tax=Ceratina calcarata TaxID=156304 RepID=A0AAJ7NC36_9HYME|nr:putative serine protease K12H4.7 [Ceratina calcarata]